MKKIALALVAVALTSSPAFAAGKTATAQGSATAKIVKKITLEHDLDAVLSFGTIIGGTAGTVVVAPNGTLVSSTPTQTSDSVVSADAFTVKGDPGRLFTIDTSGGNVSDGTTTMAFTTVASAPTGAIGLLTGEANFTVGGTLTVLGTEDSNTYTGSYDATVTYQ